MKFRTIFTFLLLCITGITYSNIINQNPFADKFFTGAYNAPPANELSQKRVNEIAEAGIDVIIAGGGKKYLSKIFNYAQKAGVKVIPMDSRWINALESPNKKNIETVVKNITAYYSKNPALLAYGVYDEPAANLYPTLAGYSKIFIKADPAHPPLINLLPSYGSPIQLGAPNFRTYINGFIKKVNPSVLSYDYYPFRDGVTLFDGWHNDLRIVSEESRKANIPFWIFVQSEGIKGGLKVPSREEIFWQANTALAYGARGILWFCYWTPPFVPESKMPEKHYSAMIDIKGRKTKIYHYVKEENEFLRKSGNSLADWDNKFAAQFKDGKLVYGKSPYVNPTGEKFDLIVGTFIKQAKTRIIFSNDSFERKSNFSLENKKFKVIDSFHTKFYNNHIEIQPGGCIIIELLNSISNNNKGDK